VNRGQVDRRFRACFIASCTSARATTRCTHEAASKLAVQGARLPAAVLKLSNRHEREGASNMSNVLILGANGSVARVAIDLFLKETDSKRTLYLRDARRVKHVDAARLVHGRGRDRLRDDAEGRAVPGRRRVAEEHRGPGGEAGRVAGAGSAPQPGREQA